ncbi:MAG: efflux RND transporter permease subunit, partial [Gammaproteobacteria bacterium]
FGELDAVRRVSSLASLPLLSNDGDTLLVRPHLDVVCGNSGCDLSRLMSIVDRGLVGRFISRDGEALSVIANVDMQKDDGSLVVGLAAQYLQILDEFERKFPEFRAQITGAIPMMNAFYQAALEDSVILLPIAFGLIFLVLMVLTRSVWFCSSLAACGLLCVVTVMGTVGWLGIPLNTATATVPLVVFTVVVASVMHPLMRLLQCLADNSNNLSGSVIEASLKSVRPNALSAGTTILSFMSMSSVGSPPLRELGVMASFGVAVSFVLSAVVIPWSMVNAERYCRMPWSRRRFEYSTMLSSLTVRSRLAFGRFKILSALIIAVLAGYGMSRFEFDEDFVKYFSSESDFRKDTESIAETFAGPYQIELEVNSGFSSGVFDPDFKSALVLIHERLRQHVGVVGVYSFLNVLTDLESKLRAGEDNDSDSLAQYFFAYELSLPKGQDVTDLVNVDRSAARVSVALKDISMSDIRLLIEEIEGWAGDISPMKLTVTGEAVPTSFLSGDTIRQMLLGVVTSILVSAFLLAASMRRARVWIVMIVAASLPAFVGFGVWGLVGGDVGMSTTLVIATTIGLIIDDTIHLIFRFSEETPERGRNGLDVESRALAGTSPAMIATSVAMTAGFAVLAFSDFEMNRTFGICACLVAVFALAFNIWYTPRLISWAMEPKRYQRGQGGVGIERGY